MQLNNSASDSVPKPDSSGQETAEKLMSFVTDCKNEYSLFEAISSKDVKKVKQLLEHGANVNATNSSNQTPLHEALWYKADVSMVRELLCHGADVHAVNSYGYTPLHCGLLRCASVACIKELLKHKSNVHALQYMGNTPLHICFLGNVSVQSVKELLKHGADVHATNCMNQTPLHFISGSKTYPEIIRVLLRHGANPNAVDIEGNTPLHYIADDDVTAQCVRVFLNHGADVNATGVGNCTPLHILSICGTNRRKFKEMLLHGAHVNAVTNDGNTPLHCCLIRGAPVEYVKALLKHGAHVNITNNSHKTPLHLAVVSKYKNMKSIQAILAHGADINIADNKGITPLGISMNRVPLAKLLVRYALFHNVGDSSDAFNLMAYAHSKNYNTVASYFQKCVCELVKMKAMKVNNRLSLYALVATKISTYPLYSKNECTQHITQTKTLIANYPIFSGIMLPKIKYALERGKLLCALNDVCIYSTNYNGLIREENIVLSYDCVSVIAKFLSNVNLCNLMLAFYNSKLGHFESYVTTTSLEKAKLEKRLLDSPISRGTKKQRFD